jgi:hypothetical protein
MDESPWTWDFTDLFPNPTRIPAVVEQAIRKGIDIIWMQLSVIHNEAAQKAIEAGAIVVMDKCIQQEHEKMTSWYPLLLMYRRVSIAPLLLHFAATNPLMGLIEEAFSSMAIFLSS